MPIHLYIYYLWLLSQYSGRNQELWHRPSGPQNLKYLLSGPLRKSFADLCSAFIHFTSIYTFNTFYFLFGYFNYPKILSLLQVLIFTKIMNYIPKSMANFKLLHLLKLCLNYTRFQLRSRRLKQFLIYTLLNCSYKGSLRSQIFSHIHSRENIKYVQVSSYSFLYLFIWLH